MGKSQGDHNQHDVRPTVAERLKLLREGSGLSLRDLEKQLGADGPSRSSIHRYEKGRAQPTAGHLKAYERFYGLDPGSLLSRDYERLADVRGRMVVGRFIVSIMLVAVTAVVVWMAHSRSSSSSEPNMAPSIDRLETFSAPISASPQVLPSTGSAAPTIGLAAAPIPLTVGLRHPAEIAVDRTDGALIVVDTENDRVVRIDLARASFSVLAGTGKRGYNGDGQPGETTQLNFPDGLAITSDGRTVIADSGNLRIRMVGDDRRVETVLGTGTSGFTGDGGLGWRAEMTYSEALATGEDGSIYVADTDNQRVRRIGPDGVVITVVGDGRPMYAGDGAAATSASLRSPGALLVQADGTLLIADTLNHVVRAVDDNGVIRTLAGTGIEGFDGDGPATQVRLNAPQGLAVDPDGSVYVADTLNNRVVRITRSGFVETVAGDGTPDPHGDGALAVDAGISFPQGIAFGPHGTLYIAERGSNRIRAILPNHNIVTVAT